MFQNYEKKDRVPYTFEPVILKYPEEIKELVSILIPIYNAELYLREALDSVVAQTFENWEAILVNDGSTDKSSEICKEYVKKDSRFKYICKEKNEGLLLARKTGLENSCGEFIANLDSDDIYCPQFLEKMWEAIMEENSDFVQCGIVFWQNKGSIERWSNYKFSENKLENVYNFTSSLCMKLIKRKVYAKVLFPQIRLINGEDYIVALQIAYHSKQAKCIPESLYIYRIDSVTSASKTTSVISKEKRNANIVVSGIILYLLMERFFGTEEAKKFNLFIGQFQHYFWLSKESLIRYKIEYAESFIPAFLNGVKKSKETSLLKKIRKITYILACKGFRLPFKIVSTLRYVLWKLKL